MPHHPTAVVEESETLKLTKRIRVLIQTTGLSCDECHETIMSARNAPTEDDFRLAWNAAQLLPSPIAQRFECTSCDDKGCGFCVPCEPHGQPTD